jgi:hypothetical protein
MDALAGGYGDPAGKAATRPRGTAREEAAAWAGAVVTEPARLMKIRCDLAGSLRAPIRPEDGAARASGSKVWADLPSPRGAGRTSGAALPSGRTTWSAESPLPSGRASPRRNASQLSFDGHPPPAPASPSVWASRTVGVPTLTGIADSALRARSDIAADQTASHFTLRGPGEVPSHASTLLRKTDAPLVFSEPRRAPAAMASPRAQTHLVSNVAIGVGDSPAWPARTHAHRATVAGDSAAEYAPKTALATARKSETLRSHFSLGGGGGGGGSGQGRGVGMPDAASGAVTRVPGGRTPVAGPAVDSLSTGHATPRSEGPGWAVGGGGGLGGFSARSSGVLAPSRESIGVTGKVGSTDAGWG